MKVSIGIIAYNEEQNLPNILQNMREQTYPHEDIEIILVDGMSKDNTRQLMNEFASDNDFMQIKILDNARRIQPAGWNIVIENAEGEVIIRLDAHSIVPADFVAENVNCIMTGENVCGGNRENIINSVGQIAKTLLLAETSMFGSSPAPYRRNTNKQYVKTLAHACYRAEVFTQVGKFNESLLRAEDNEMHYRIRANGYKICSSGEIHSEYQTRPTWSGMIKQKYGNGKWIGITALRKSPAIFSLYHFIPMLFVLGMLSCILVAVLGVIFPQFALYFAMPLILVTGMYILLMTIITALAFLKSKSILALFMLPLVIVTLHISYGVGTLYGIIKAPFAKLDK